MDIFFRAAVSDDLPFLLDLRKQTMDAHISNQGLVPCEDNHWQRIHYRFDCAEILSYDKMEVGLLKVVREGDVWELVQIQLIPQVQGKGIGAAIIRDIIQQAFSERAGVKLSVFKKNPAKKLYESLGFKIYAETDTTFEMQVHAKPGNRNVSSACATVSR